MNTIFQGTLFDGETLAPRTVTLTVAGDRLQVAGPDAGLDIALADVQASDRLADVPRYLYLPGGRSIETADNAAVDAWLSGQRRGRLAALVHACEIHARAAAVATVLLVAATAGAMWWGLPVLARHAAQAVPERIESQMGEAGLLAIDRFLPDSALDRRARDRVQQQLDRLVAVAGIKRFPRLVFRAMGNNSANAFALPGGIIIVSDELVKLADTDEEIAAVLAHELGHWQHRHGIQGVLRSSAALLVVSTVTGDLSTLTTFASTIPFTLLQRGYSREFEAEADRYAVDLLRKAGIAPEQFASILDKLEKSRPEMGNNFSYFSTHPNTGDRIKAIAPAFVPQETRKAKPAESFGKFKSSEPVKPDLDRVFSDPTKLEPTDKPPRSLFRQIPAYPPEMRRNLIGGSVTLEFTIDPTGKVHSIRVVRSTYAEFEAPAIDAVRQWTFVPAERDGQNIAVRVSQTLEFDPHLSVPAAESSTQPSIEILPPATKP